MANFLEEMAREPILMRSRSLSRACGWRAESMIRLSRSMSWMRVDTSLDLRGGENRLVTYITNVAKTPTVEESFGFFRQSTIEDGGDRAAHNLASYDEVTCLGSEYGWALIQRQNMADHPMVSYAEKLPYGYDMRFGQVDVAACCKNLASVHDGNAACSYYYKDSMGQSFSLPKHTCNNYDDCENLVDVFGEFPTDLEQSVEQVPARHFFNLGSIRFVTHTSNWKKYGGSNHGVISPCHWE